MKIPPPPPPTPGAKLFVVSLISQQLTAYAYHHNSYAATPKMLKSDKPQVMRDIFLTRACQWMPTPLSSLYCSTKPELFMHITVAVAVGIPVVTTIGAGHATALYFLGGWFGSAAYIFQSQINPNKNTTVWDVNSTSAAATAALCMPAKMHLDKHRRIAPVAVGTTFVLYKLLEEYAPWSTGFYETKDPGKEVVPQVHEWGVIGGVFLGAIYHTLFLRTKFEQKAAAVFLKNLKI